MTAQRSHRLGMILITLASAASLATAQAGKNRAFGQLQPGQSVVEINQADAVYDNAWSPVAQSPRLIPVPAAPNDEPLEPVPANIPAIGGMSILEGLASRQAEADLASQKRAAQLSAQRSTQATPDRGSLLDSSLPVQEKFSIGPSTLSTKPAASTSEPTAAAPSTNLAGDWLAAQGPAVQTMLALGGVILLIYALAWIYRKMGANRGGVAGVNSGKAPAGLLEVLGRYPLGNKQSLVLLKFDRRVLLLTQGPSGKGGVQMTTLCELDEPEDVASVLMKVRDADGDSLDKAFKSAMSRAQLGSGASARSVEPKPIKPRRTTKPAPNAQVLPGHHDPFAGVGGNFIGQTRTTSTTPEGDRSELWGDSGQDGAAQASDPVASLRQRLEAMRRGDRVK